MSELFAQVPKSAFMKMPARWRVFSMLSLRSDEGVWFGTEAKLTRDKVDWNAGGDGP